MTHPKVERFRNWVGTANDGRYARKITREMLMVSSVETDSAGGLRTVSGPVVEGDGTLSQATFTVPMRGKTAAVGEFLWVGREAGQAAGAELTYIDHAESPYPGAGLVTVDGNLPAPTGISIASTLVVLPGSITARATVTFTAAPSKYQASGYTVSFQIDGGEWSDRHVPHLGGSQQCVLGSDFPPGATLTVHIRTKASWLGVESVPSADVSATLAADTSSAGTVTALAYDVTVPNQVVITPTVTINAALFRGIQYEINDAASGLPDLTTVPVGDAGPYALVLPPGTYYAAARTVSRSGVLGTRFPSTGFNGPFTIIDQSANLDVTAPAAMGSAPTLATRTSQFADNTYHGFITVTRPTYTPPADLDHYEISIVCNDGRAWVREIPAGTTVWDEEVGFGQFTVSMRAVDKAQNKPSFSPTAVATISAPSFAGAAPTVTTGGRGAGILVSWTPVTNAHHYEVQRATDGAGTGATTIGTADGLWFLDTLTGDTIILPTYYYRARAIGVSNGSAVNGTYSSWVAGTALAVDGQNLRALSVTAAVIAAGAVTANKLEADLILATIIRTATSGARFEIEGLTGSGTQVQIRAYAADGTVLWRLSSAGLEFLNSGGTVVGSFARSGGDVEVNLQNLRLNSSGAFIRADLADFFINEAATGMGNWRQGYALSPIDSSPVYGFVSDSINAQLVFGFNGGRGVKVGAGFYTSGQERFVGILPNGKIGFGDMLLDSGYTYIEKLAAGTIGTAGRLIGQTAVHGGVYPTIVTSGVLTARRLSALGNSTGNTLDIGGIEMLLGDASVTAIKIYGERSINSSGPASQYVRLEAVNGASRGGNFELGFAGSAGSPVPWWAHRHNNTIDLQWDNANNRVLAPGDFRVGGTLSKVSGTFDIPSPVPGREQTHRLRHGFVESPTRGDTLYRFAAYVPLGSEGAEILADLPDYFPHLNEHAQCWVSPVRHFGRAWAEVRGAGCEWAMAADSAGWYNVLVIATRKDAGAVANWDRIGGGAVEYRARGTEGNGDGELGIAG